VIRGLPLKVVRVELRQETGKDGLPVDLSNVTLEDSSTKERLVLVKDLPAKTSASFALLVSTDGKTTLKVHQGDVFTWPAEQGVTYQVVDMSQDQVVLRQIENKKVWTIPREVKKPE
jgi:RNase P/RNase MRP subunit p29